jgi:hypothetical protein
MEDRLKKTMVSKLVQTTQPGFVAYFKLLVLRR